jgi:hypothetical protein
LTHALRNYPRILPNGDLEQEHASVLENLKYENQRYFDRQIRRTSRGWFSDVKERRALLEQAGCVLSCRLMHRFRTWHVHILCGTGWVQVLESCEGDVVVEHPERSVRYVTCRSFVKDRM